MEMDNFQYLFLINMFCYVLPQTLSLSSTYFPTLQQLDNNFIFMQ